MSSYIIDCETTGSENPQPIEIAYARVEPPGIIVGDVVSRRYQATELIRLGAMAIHHITDEDILLCEPGSTFKLPDDADYLVGHSVDYDWAAIGKPPVRRICTLALARAAWPDLDSHSLGAVIYYLDRRHAKMILRNAHNAASDVIAASLVLREALKTLGPISGWEDAWRLSEAARVPKTMPFGKHRGKKISELPASYVKWLLRDAEIDEYMIRALKVAGW